MCITCIRIQRITLLLYGLASQPASRAILRPVYKPDQAYCFCLFQPIVIEDSSEDDVGNDVCSSLLVWFVRM